MNPNNGFFKAHRYLLALCLLYLVGCKIYESVYGVPPLPKKVSVTADPFSRP